jgi:glycosyltransferase involved in cell wall biosynthesis
MVHIVQIIDKLSLGGAQQLLVTFARTMQTSGVRLSVISLSDDAGSVIGAELKAAEAGVIAFPAASLFDPVRIWKITRWLQREGAEVVYTHLTYANIIGVLAGRLAGLPVLATLHNEREDPRYYNPIRYRLETWALRSGAQRVIAVGQLIARAHRARLQTRRIDVVPNAVPMTTAISPAERDALRTEVAGDPARPLLISVGRLSPQKGFHDLLQALASVRQVHPSVKLAIVGSGRLKGDLAAAISDLQLEDAVTLLGERRDVPQLLFAADMYVSASHWEGLPLAILEAMAAGLPIVATSVGEIPKVVIEGTGLLLPARDPRALAAGVTALLDNPSQMLALGWAAQSHVARYYSPTAWADRLLALCPVEGRSGGLPIRLGEEAL